MDEKSAFILATLDTKGEEALFLKNFFESNGVHAVTLDLGIYKEPSIEPDVSREELLKLLSLDPSEFSRGVLSGEIRRDEAIKTMGIAAGKFLVENIDKIGGVIAIGGNQGTAASSIAMRHLPIGIPKIIVSTVASGNIRPYIEYKDIMMLFSVADLEFGPNSISKLILSNAAAALIGMIKSSEGIIKDEGKSKIAISTLGSTGFLTRMCANKLKELGYEPVVFHASGAGGSAMEELIESGFFQGVLDLNLHELVGELIPDDIYRPMKPRLENAVEMGLPVVVVPGSINYLVFGPPESIPEIYRGRKTHYHNPYNTNVRLSREELLKVAELLVSKLNKSKGNVAVVLPERGLSVLDIPGGPLHQPDEDELFFRYLKENLSSRVMFLEIEDHINGEKTADAVISCFRELWDKKKI